MLAGSLNIRLAQATRIESLDCANFVPTLCMEAFRSIASAIARTSRKPLKTSNLAQLLAILGNARKLLIIRGPLATNQKVRCSNHLGRTTKNQPLMP
jgi:hypothetical protein